LLNNEAYFNEKIKIINQKEEKANNSNIKKP